MGAILQELARLREQVDARPGNALSGTRLDLGEQNALFRRSVGEDQLWLAACREAVSEGVRDALDPASHSALSLLLGILHRRDRTASLTAVAIARASQAAIRLRTACGGDVAARGLAAIDLADAAVLWCAAHQGTADGGAPTRGDQVRVEPLVRIGHEIPTGLSVDCTGDSFVSARNAAAAAIWPTGVDETAAARAILAAVKRAVPHVAVGPTACLVQYLLEEDVPIEGTQVGVKVLLDLTDDGLVAELVLQRLCTGCGELVADPRRMAFFCADRSFWNATADAWAYAASLRSTHGDGGDVMWRLTARPTARHATVHLERIEGDSIGLGFAVALLHLFDRDREPLRADDEWALTGRVAPDGSVRAVDGYPRKLERAQAEHLRVIVPTESHAGLVASWPRTRLEVHGASSVADASAAMTGLTAAALLTDLRASGDRWQVRLGRLARGADRQVRRTRRDLMLPPSIATGTVVADATAAMVAPVSDVIALLVAVAWVGTTAAWAFAATSFSGVAVALCSCVVAFLGHRRHWTWPAVSLLPVTAMAQRGATAGGIRPLPAIVFEIDVSERGPRLGVTAVGVATPAPVAPGTPVHVWGSRPPCSTKIRAWRVSAGDGEDERVTLRAPRLVSLWDVSFVLLLVVLVARICVLVESSAH